MGTMEEVVRILAHALAARARRTLDESAKTRAAVLVPLLAVDDAPHVLFTRRANDLPHHRGEVAFPGGSHHPGDDADLSFTALRESHEEIGLAPGDVRLLGALDDIETMASRFVITPFVGVVPYPYPWRPCADEVDTIFTVPLHVLHTPSTLQRETWDFGGRMLPVDTYRVHGQVIWGATHRITRNLLSLLDTPAHPAPGAST